MWASCSAVGVSRVRRAGLGISTEITEVGGRIGKTGEEGEGLFGGVITGAGKYSLSWSCSHPGEATVEEMMVESRIEETVEGEFIFVQWFAG